MSSRGNYLCLLFSTTHKYTGPKSSKHLQERGKVKEHEIHRSLSQIPKGKVRLQISEGLRRDWELLEGRGHIF